MSRYYRFSISKQTLIMIGLVFFSSVTVFIRMLYADNSFSFDYSAYISIIKKIGSLSYFQLFGSNLDFPYTITSGITPIEFGFSLIVKTISVFGFGPSVTFAILAGFSVGLRVYTMRSLGMPVLWILWCNVFLITLLEANALRLGIAASMLMFGLLQLKCSRKILGIIVILLTPFFHLQVVIFIIPFFAFYFFPWRLNRSKLRVSMMLVATSVATVFAIQFLSLIPNEKVQEYLSRGASGSAGITTTSVLTLLLLLSAAIALRKNRRFEEDSSFFTGILLAFVPSTMLFVFLTNVAVIGNRAWQLAFFIFLTFFFSQWAYASLRRIPLVIFMVLTLVVQVNVIIRYPLSNFFSPPFPEVEIPVR